MKQTRITIIKLINIKYGIKKNTYSIPLRVSRVFIKNIIILVP